MKKFYYIVMILFVVILPHSFSHAQSLGQRLAGKLLLQVQDHGRVWYVAPSDFLRYEVTFQNALPLFEQLALGITNQDLQRIDRDKNFAQGLRGKLLLQVEDRGRIWYVDFSGNRHEVTWANLLPLFEKLSLGITNNNLALIEIGSLQNTSTYNNAVDATGKNDSDQNSDDFDEVYDPNNPTIGANNFAGVLANTSLHNYVNDYRTDLGLNALILDKDLCSLVDVRIEEIKADFSHSGFEAMFDNGDLDFLNYRSIGENLFMANYGDESTAIDGWHNSSGHRENMRGDWTHACSKLVDGYGVSLFMTVQ